METWSPTLSMSIDLLCKIVCSLIWLKLSSFVEKDVFPFLADLMKHLLSLLEKVETDETTLKLKELAFSCIASIGECFKSMDC